MGNKQSKIKTPYEILNIEPTSTKNEIRSAYIKLMLLHHPTRQKKSDPQKAVDITNAYTTIKSSTPLFEYYTEELFKKDFMKYAADFYERIGDFCGIVSPDFITNYIELDDRIVKEDTKALKKPVTSSVTVERKPNIKPYCCNECKKNFKSKNQLINHYNSKKHYLAVEEMVEDPKLFVQRQIQSIEDISFEEEESKNLKDEITDIFEHLTLQKKLSSYEDVL
ncbi:PREDICTED: uncharacterized protein LOC107073459 [Polistes dominula]|uniref:Uncharacterized protein LOC107073459 n=1 Tax=Polistes dominula TaxID=743375 RepID=A0ABM1JAY5_POLDO|nr:PREDICTED: uncharacterized protein LOC107073459 [Polistes dominula]